MKIDWGRRHRPEAMDGFTLDKSEERTATETALILARSGLSIDDLRMLRQALGLAIVAREGENSMADPGSETDRETSARLIDTVVMYRAVDLAWHKLAGERVSIP